MKIRVVSVNQNIIQHNFPLKRIPIDLVCNVHFVLTALMGENTPKGYEMTKERQLFTLFSLSGVHTAAETLHCILRNRRKVTTNNWYQSLSPIRISASAYQSIFSLRKSSQPSRLSYDIWNFSEPFHFWDLNGNLYPMGYLIEQVLSLWQKQSKNTFPPANTLYIDIEGHNHKLVLGSHCSLSPMGYQIHLFFSGIHSPGDFQPQCTLGAPSNTTLRILSVKGGYPPNP